MRITRSHLVRGGCIVLCCCFLATAFEVALVPTRSMERTVLVGDHILVFKLFDAPRLPGVKLRLPRFKSPRREMLVSFLAPDGSGTIYLKRVVAVAGDTVEMRDGVLYLNGLKRKEAYAPRSNRVPNLSPRALHSGELFVLGDNRDFSEDSRDFGPIAVESVVGSPVLVVWSPRARTSDFLDAQGNVRLTYYWTAVRHLWTNTRWSRTGKLL